MIKHECGVAGVFGHTDAAELVRQMLVALQHRGEEGTGIVTVDDSNMFRCHKDVGKVFQVFQPDVMAKLQGGYAIGHNRYSTTGASSLENVQPFLATGFAICHNGNLTNTSCLKSLLIGNTVTLESGSDTEVVKHLVMQAKGSTLEDRIKSVVHQIEGAYNLLFLAPGKLIIVRDPWGNRPLVMGKVGDAHVIASETCALDQIGATDRRDIAAGEMIVITEGGVQSSFPLPREVGAECTFEYFYFARPDSVMNGRSIASMRIEAGRMLARKTVTNADIVVPVLNSGRFYAQGFSEVSGIPLVEALHLNEHAPRTFIQPNQEAREQAVEMKHRPIAALVAGKRIVQIDDSMVRSTTTMLIVKLFREAGAKEVHLRIAYSPVWSPCNLGIDFASQDQLIACGRSDEEICRHVGADSLVFLSPEEVTNVVRGDVPVPNGLCTGCITGQYPRLRGEQIVPRFAMVTRRCDREEQSV